MPQRPDLVIFDCDGVLVDSEMLASRILAEVLSELGLPMTAAESRARFTGCSMASVRAAVEADLGRPLPDDFEDRVRLLDKALFEAELIAVEGVEAALQKIRRADVAVCVASSGSPEKIRHSLTITGLIDYFEPHIFSAQMVAHGKPAPDLFLLAAEKMGVAPERAVVIEDSLPGVQAARAANMRVLGFWGAGHASRGLSRLLQKTGAESVFKGMTTLPALLALD